MPLLYGLRRPLRTGAAVAALATLTGTLTVIAQAPPQPAASVGAGQVDAAIEASGDVEYLTSGPLHEAFATPYSADPEPGVVYRAEPPVPIEEVPPEYVPEGHDVQWIPGYWMWSDQVEDYIWISGVWRDIPPGMQWVPGYWESYDGGYHYVAGFWASNEVREISYLPPPPESMEQGPSSPAPGENYFYVPGYWVHQGNDYAWTPGFWSESYEDWVWVPAQYVWTPRGCVYLAGYWDYAPAYRGVVFTPVHFRQPVYLTPQYSYRPQYVVDTDLSLLVHLFSRTGYRQYYYGNYYGATQQYVPWGSMRQHGNQYDPLIAYYSVANVRGRSNPISWVQERYQFYATNESLRPRRTVLEQRRLLQSAEFRNLDPTTQRLTSLVSDIGQLARDNDSTFGFQRVDAARRQQAMDAVQPLRELADERVRIETGVEAGVRGATEARAESDATVRADGNATANVEGDDAANAAGNAATPAGDDAEARTGDDAEARTDRNRGRGARGRVTAGADGDVRLRLPGADRAQRENRRDQQGDQADRPEESPIERLGQDRESMRQRSGNLLDRATQELDRAEQAAETGTDRNPIRAGSRPGRGLPAQDRAGQDRLGQDRPGQDRAGQDLDRAAQGLDRPGQGLDPGFTRPTRPDDWPTSRRSFEERSNQRPAIPGLSREGRPGNARPSRPGGIDAGTPGPVDAPGLNPNRGNRGTGNRGAANREGGNRGEGNRGEGNRGGGNRGGGNRNRGALSPGSPNPGNPAPAADGGSQTEPEEESGGSGEE